MSKDTLAVITAVNAALEGTSIAPIVIPAQNIADPQAGNGSAMAANWDGRMMKSAPGTATPGQQRWQVEHTRITAKGAAKLSMVEASNRRAKVEGRI